MLLVFAFASEQERDKFEFLYSKYKNLLLRKAYDILKDRMLAEDAVSEAYMRVYKNLDKIDDPTSNRSIAFLVTIAKNAALTILSGEAKKAADPIEDDLADSYSLEAEVLSEISTDGILALMEQLSEELRGVFLLKYAYDLPHKEIGRLLGITENNVTVRLFRAKKKLSELLVKEGYARE